VSPLQEQTQETPSLRQQYADWPQKADTRAQPWDLDKLGVSQTERVLEAGKANTVSPIVIRHSYPILASGSAGSVVTELASRLNLLGYTTDVSRGENHYGVLTHDVMSAVEQFRQEFNVREDPTPFGGNTEQSRAKAAAIVGPFTWEAVLRASQRALEASR
jgi:peptidoglycan hydrolase-like protein with peptidoglycan-binding domain